MKRILVISDIHGEIEKFEQLLVEAQYDVKAGSINFTRRLCGSWSKCACSN